MSEGGIMSLISQLNGPDSDLASASGLNSACRGSGHVAR